MTVSPLDGRLYVSDYRSRRLLRVKTMGAVRDLKQNAEVIAGTGELCVPGDASKCGEGGPASAAKLSFPKGNYLLALLVFLVCEYWQSGEVYWH